MTLRNLLSPPWVQFSELSEKDGSLSISSRSFLRIIYLTLTASAEMTLLKLGGFRTRPDLLFIPFFQKSACS